MHTLSHTTQAWTRIFICMLPHTAYGLLHPRRNGPDICRLSHTKWNTQVWMVHLKGTPTYTPCLLQPDIRRISKTGRNDGAPYPLELIHFTALLFVSFHTKNLLFHLHLLISGSLSPFLLSSLSSVANRIVHSSPLCAPPVFCCSNTRAGSESRWRCLGTLSVPLAGKALWWRCVRASWDVCAVRTNWFWKAALNV